MTEQSKYDYVVSKSGFSWATFFKEAGLPASVCANYAVLFIDNRMKKSMLPDINKEILHELGIRAVGDVIAILRYAKLFHAETQKKHIGYRNIDDGKTTLVKMETKSEDRPIKEKGVSKNKEILTKLSKNSSGTNHSTVKEKKDMVKLESDSISKSKYDKEETKIRKKRHSSNSSSRAEVDEVAKKLTKRHHREVKQTSPSEKTNQRRSKKDHHRRNFESGTESDTSHKPVLAKKKRTVTMEDMPIKKIETEKDGKVAKREPKVYRKVLKRSPISSDRRLQREESFHSDPEMSDQSPDEESPRVSCLQKLALRLDVNKYKDMIERSPSMESSSSPPEDFETRNQTVKLVLPAESQVVRMRRIPQLLSKKVSDDEYIQEPERDCYRPSVNDRYIRDMLTKGRMLLDYDRHESGLDYLGTFKTDLEDERRPTSLVSDQRSVKILNRLGVKVEEKPAEAHINGGSLTIVDDTGDRKTTLLSKDDKTVIKLCKGDSVFKRLGPEQKVPINPSTMGILGTEPYQNPLVSSYRTVSTTVQRTPISPLMDKKDNYSKISARSSRSPHVGNRTDLRDVISCKGGFIPSNDFQSASSKSSFSEPESSLIDLRSRLRTSSPPKSFHRGSVYGRIAKVSSSRITRESSASSLVDRIVKDVMNSRSVDGEWLF